MKAFILLFWVVWTLGAVAQEEKIHWLTMTEADKLYQENPKPMVIDFTRIGAAGVSTWTKRPTRIRRS